MKKWFYVENGQRVGPIAEDQLIQLLQDNCDQKFSEETFVWSQGMANWQKLADLPELKQYLFVPPPPLEPPASTAKATAATTLDWESIDRDKKIFFTKQDVDSNIFGPYALNTLQQLFQDGRINNETFIFTPLQEGWMILADLPIYQDVFLGSPPPLSEAVLERRESLRSPFVARIFLHNQKTLFEGICRDISLGGMQILLSDFPVERGEEISMNVHPENSQFHFLAKGIVSRKLAGQQGIFIRFTSLDEQAQKTITTYLNSNTLD